MPVKQQVANSCHGTWKTEMFKAPCEAPLQFCYGCLCICCATYQQRSELLDMTGEPYVCCAGLCPCGPLGEPQDRNCLFLEACCCPGFALSGNRFMVQTRFDKENTPCDDCILWFTCLFVYGVQIARCFCEDIPEELDLIADLLVHIVQGCMHAQQHIEIQDIKKNGGYHGPPAAVLAGLPPQQQKMMQMGQMGGGPGPATVGAAGGAAAGAGMWGGQQQGQKYQPEFQHPPQFQTQPQFAQP